MTLTSAIDGYLTLTRSLGAGLQAQASMLRAFGRAVGDIPLDAIAAEACATFCRGTGAPMLTRKPRARRDACLRATARCSTRSAATSREPGASSRPSRPAVIPYGGLATTRNGRPGSRRLAASACTTVTSGNLWRSRAARPGCSSTATTRAPARIRGAVSAPSPAPMSRTSSPGRTPACATIRAAHS